MFIIFGVTSGTYNNKNISEEYGKTPFSWSYNRCRYTAIPSEAVVSIHMKRSTKKIGNPTTEYKL